MKITQKGPDSVKASRPASSGEAPVPLPPQAPPPDADSVQLSTLAATSSQVTAGDTPFDASHVEHIKNAIRNGEFTVNAEVVADKLLEIERGLAPGAQ